VQSGKERKKVLPFLTFHGDAVKLMEEGKVRKVLFGI